MSAIERTTEIQYFIVVIVIFMIRFGADGDRDNVRWRAAVELGLLGFVAVKLKLNAVFWEQKINQLMLYGCFVLIGCVASYILVTGTGNEYFEDSRRTVVCIVCAFLVKISFN
jgi:hypothetical protein